MANDQYPVNPYAQQPQQTYADPYAQQQYQENYQYAQHAAQTAAPVQSAKKGGGVKTFFTAFLGALLACALAFGGFMLYRGNAAVPSLPSADSAEKTPLGTQGSTTINAATDDIKLPEVVAAKALPSVVCIYVYSTQSPYSMYGINMGSGSGTLTQTSLGSGVILTEDGYILTNYHVVEGSEALKVNIGGEERDAAIVGTDPSSDLAVIKVDGVSGLVVAELGDSDDLVVGEWVMTIGAPFGLEQSVATGIVSATSRSQIMENSSSYDYLYGYGATQSSPTLYPNLIQTDAAINPGNSGGALVDAQGKVIGINTLITSYSGNYSGVGFAIPINYASSIAQQIIEGKTPTHAKLGVSLVTLNKTIQQRYKLATDTGCYINNVEAGSAADEAGLQQGDIITSIAGHKVKTNTEVTLYIREHNPGDTIEVVVNRNGQEVTVQATLGSDEEQLAASTSAREELGQLFGGGSDSSSGNGSDSGSGNDGGFGFSFGFPRR